MKQTNYLLWFQYISLVVLIVLGLFAPAEVATQYYLAVGALIGKLGFDYREKKRGSNGNSENREVGLK